MLHPRPWKKNDHDRGRKNSTTVGVSVPICLVLFSHTHGEKRKKYVRDSYKKVGKNIKMQKKMQKVLYFLNK